MFDSLDYDVIYYNYLAVDTGLRLPVIIINDCWVLGVSGSG